MAENPRESQEPEAVRTTIVGARPPAAGRSAAEVPRGVEVLVKKAAVDREFCKLLLETRAEAALEIDLLLEPAEVIMLTAVPAEQLEAIIARTKVDPKHRPAFLGKVAAAMLAALGVAALPGCYSAGIAPDHPPDSQPADKAEEEESAAAKTSHGAETTARRLAEKEADRRRQEAQRKELEKRRLEEARRQYQATLGIRPDPPPPPPPQPRGIRPDRPTKGIRPDRPK